VTYRAGVRRFLHLLGRSFARLSHFVNHLLGLLAAAGKKARAAAAEILGRGVEGLCCAAAEQEVLREMGKTLAHSQGPPPLTCAPNTEAEVDGGAPVSVGDGVCV